MIRIILKVLLLMTLTVAAGLSSVSHAQQPTTALTGEWVGNSNLPDRSELVRLSLTEDAGEIRVPLSRFSQKLTLVQREDSRVRFELSSLKLVMTGTISGDEIDGEAEVPGTKAQFHLTRTRKVRPEILASYVGAYRFRNGDYFVIDRFDYIPDILHVIDVKSGETRAIFPRSETQFISGPALYVASPTRRTITFRGARAHVVDLDLKSRQSDRKPGADAVRIPIRQEEVTFKNGDVTLAGTLVTPASKAKRRPAIVFTHGGGPAVREVYWGLGYLYAARGFVVLSYDKRGVGKSTGNWLAASFEQLADDAVAAAKFLQTRSDVNPKQIGFWGLSQGGWIAPLAASRFPDAAFAIALSGGGLSPAEQELFDSEYELTKAGYTANEVKDALTFQRLKNEIIASQDKWDEYAKMRLTAKDQKWFRHRGIDVFGPEKRDDPFWAYMRKFYVYDPSPTLRSMNAPLLAIFGELDTPEGVKANVRAIKQIMDGAGRRDYIVKVYPSAVHNLMEAPRDNPNEYVRLKRFPPGLFETMVDWTMTQLRRRPQ
jgi:pimeloyl-ACP methyl ester carboxylesterase